MEFTGLRAETNAILPQQVPLWTVDQRHDDLHINDQQPDSTMFIS